MGQKTFSICLGGLGMRPDNNTCTIVDSRVIEYDNIEIHTNMLEHTCTHTLNPAVRNYYHQYTALPKKKQKNICCYYLCYTLTILSYMQLIIGGKVV